MSAGRFNQLVSHLRSLADDECGDGRLLVQFAGAGDADAFAEIVHRHGRLVHGVCRRVLGGGPDLDDAFQATFVVLARKAASIRKPGALASWLYGVAYRVASDLRKRRTRRRGHEAGSLEQAPEPRTADLDPAARAGWHEVGAILDEELSRLPAADREALVVCLMEGMSHSEAARQLGWPLGTLKSRLERGRQTLRDRLERRGLALSAMALSVVLAEQARAAVPPGLVRTTLQAAVHRTASSQVVALADRAARALGFGAVRTTLIAALTPCALAAGIALTLAGARDEPPAQPAAPAAPAARDVADDPGPAAVPNLPAGAVRAFGAVPFHNGARIETSELSPDGTRLATLGHRSVSVWDTATGRRVHRFFFEQPAFPIWSDGLAFSPDGRRLAVRPARDRIVVYDVAAGKEVRRLTVAEPAGYAFALFRFSADGKAVITQCDKDVAWIDVATGAVASRLRGVRLQQLSPDDRTFAAVNERDRVVLVGDVATGQVRHRLSVAARADARERGLLFLPDNTTLAAVAHLGDPAKNDFRLEVQFWDAKTGQQRPNVWRLPPSDQRESYRLSLSPDGKILYFPEDRKNIRRYVVASGRELTPLELAGRWTTAALPHPDGKTLFAVHLDEIRRWDLVTAEPLAPARDEDYPDWWQAALSADGRWAALSANQGPLELADAATGHVKRVEMRQGFNRSLSFAPDGKTLAVGRYDHVAFLSVPDLAEVRKLDLGPQPLTQEGSTRFSPDGRYLAVLESVARLRVFDLTTNQVVCAMPEVHTFAFAPDGRRMLVVPRKGSVLRLCETVGGKVRFEVPWPGERDQERMAGVWHVKALAFAPDGRTLVVAMDGGGMWLLDAETGRERAAFPTAPTLLAPGPNAHYFAQMSALTFSADGQWLAAGGTDGYLQIWDVATRRALHLLHGHEDAVQTLAFSADGRRLLSFCQGEAIVWDLRPAAGKKPADAFADLRADDGPTVYRAVWSLANDPEAPARLRSQLPPAQVNADPRRVARLIADVDSSDFDVRDAAQRELAALGEGARPALTAALKEPPSLEASRRLHKLLDALETPGPNELRVLRAVQAMALSGTPAARQLLREWADGTPGLRLTDAARAALARLGR